MSERPASQQAHWPEGAVFTLGHSTLPIERFMALLHAYGIKRLVDIRSMPRSQHNPQFNDTVLASKTWHTEGISHQRPVTAPRHRFGTHDRDALFSAQRDQRFKRVLKLLGRHIVGIAAKALVSPAGVERLFMRPSQPTERFHMDTVCRLSRFCR